MQSENCDLYYQTLRGNQPLSHVCLIRTSHYRIPDIMWQQTCKHFLIKPRNVCEFILNAHQSSGCPRAGVLPPGTVMHTATLSQAHISGPGVSFVMAVGHRLLHKGIYYGSKGKLNLGRNPSGCSGYRYLMTHFKWSQTSFLELKRKRAEMW